MSTWEEASEVVQALSRFEVSIRAHEMMGTRDPADFDIIETEYRDARTDLLDVLQAQYEEIHEDEDEEFDFVRLLFARFLPDARPALARDLRKACCFCLSRSMRGLTRVPLCSEFSTNLSPKCTKCSVISSRVTEQICAIALELSGIEPLTHW